MFHFNDTRIISNFLMDSRIISNFLMDSRTLREYKSQNKYSNVVFYYKGKIMTLKEEQGQRTNRQC